MTASGDGRAKLKSQSRWQPTDRVVIVQLIGGVKWKGGICFSLCLQNISPPSKRWEVNSWHQLLRSEMSANVNVSASPATVSLKIRRRVLWCDDGEQTYHSCGDIWLKTIWKCDSMSAGRHLFSPGLLLRGIFMEELTQLWERGNEDGHLSYHNKISTTWQRLHGMLVICGNRELGCVQPQSHWGHRWCTIF